MTNASQYSILPETADFFAAHQHKDYIIFQKLLTIETSQDFRRVLEELIQSEYDDYQFWLQFSGKKEFRVPWHEIVFFILLRRVFGLTFTAKFLEGDERKIISEYQKFLDKTQEPLRSKVAEILARERKHEQMLIAQFREGKVDFLGNIILGLNDGLVELSGALIGFSLTIKENKIIGMLGMITGVAAAFSMSASAFLQARVGKAVPHNPLRCAAYTGITYLIVVLLLVAPFFFFHTPFALASLAAIVFIIILFTSFYSSVILDRRFGTVFAEMMALSVGVAVIIFLFAQSLQTFF